MQRPWNKSPEVVYSLSTLGENNIPNMNICTYVVPISMQPKKYMIALDPHTQTYKNFVSSHFAILQIFGKDCKKYVTPFGRKSGVNGNKLEKYKKELIEYKQYYILKKAAAYLYVQKKEHIKVSGADHELFIVDVLSFSYQHQESDFLTTKDIF